MCELFAMSHGHRRTQRDGKAIPPGRHTLTRRCEGEPGTYDVPGLALEHGDGGAQQVTLVASVPLSGEAGWQALGEGEVLALRDGAIVAQRIAIGCHAAAAARKIRASPGWLAQR